MKTIQEITQWDWPNHTYFVSDNRELVFAYVKQNSKEVFEFRKPIQFKTGGRRFREVNNSWNYHSDQDIKDVPRGQNWTVKGSRGDEYTVNLNSGIYSCTCSGYKFRNLCRHVQEIRELNS